MAHGKILQEFRMEFLRKRRASFADEYFWVNERERACTGMPLLGVFSSLRYIRRGRISLGVGAVTPGSRYCKEMKPRTRNCVFMRGLPRVWTKGADVMEENMVGLDHRPSPGGVQPATYAIN